MAVAEKVCRDCGKSLPLTDFYVKRAATGERQSYCKLCADVRATAWQNDNKDEAHVIQQRYRDKNPEKAVLRRLRRSATDMGFDPNEIEAYFLTHNGLCDVCGQPPGERDPRSKRLCIEHDHETGEFRGLVCRKCNLAIGLMDDNPKWLIEAANYLLKEST